jgi:O-6-methylguanine DNA methyltransferase
MRGEYKRPTSKHRVAIKPGTATLSAMNIAAKRNTLQYEDVDSPVGRLRLIASGQSLVGIWFSQGRDAARGASGMVQDSSPVLECTRAQLGEYFAGERHEFNLPLDPRGTEFQRRVWQRLLHIPYGETTTYGALARELGDPGASRAVGLANGSNPIPIVIPCHRVIGADGSLTGFGGGLPIKAALLELERSATQPRLL